MASKCTFTKTYSSVNLSRVHYDACLEDNPFSPIDVNAVAIIPHTSTIIKSSKKEKSRATWYAKGFQWCNTRNATIFNTYDYVVAIGKGLEKKYLPGSLILVTNLKNGKSVVARVTDKKPRSESIDLSKAVAFGLGGYGALQEGRLNVRIDAVKLISPKWEHTSAYMKVKKSFVPKSTMSSQFKSNVFFRLGEWHFNNKHHYGKKYLKYVGANKEAFKALLTLSRFLQSNVEGYDGWPSPKLVVVHKYKYNPKTKRTEENLFLQLRIGSFQSEEQEIRIYNAVKKLVSSGKMQELTEMSEAWPRPFASRVWHKDGFQFSGINASCDPASSAWKKCAIKVYSPSYPSAVAKNRIAQAFKLPKGCISIEVPKKHGAPVIDLSAQLCFSNKKGFLHFMAKLLPSYLKEAYYAFE